MSPLVGYLLLFVLVGFGFIFVHLVAGKLVRPAKRYEEKLTIYECGEPTIGSAWVQFDLRYYVIALLFVIFDVEVAFFFPWAVVFGQANTLATLKEAEDQVVSERSSLVKRELIGKDEQGKYITEPDLPFSPGQEARYNDVGKRLRWLAFADILFFFGVLLVGFAYLWKRGDLAWVRSTAAETRKPAAVEATESDLLVGAGRG